MANSKWELFEYEYSLAEFILSFVVVFFVSFLFVTSLDHASPLNSTLLASGAIALVIGIIWTYVSARRAFNFGARRKQ